VASIGSIGMLACGFLLYAGSCIAGPTAQLREAAAEAKKAPDAKIAAPTIKADLSGHKRVGKASFYAKKFTGRKMADGTRMDPQTDNAASKTLPLGTTAKVTNLETGKSAEVTIQDRGPYVKGRIIDLSPATAKEIGLVKHDGITTVVVAPIEVPLPNGGVKPGVGAVDKTR
jgi:rare lipoprotein A